MSVDFLVCFIFIVGLSVEFLSYQLLLLVSGDTFEFLYQSIFLPYICLSRSICRSFSLFFLAYSFHVALSLSLSICLSRCIDQSFSLFLFHSISISISLSMLIPLYQSLVISLLFFHLFSYSFNNIKQSKYMPNSLIFFPSVEFLFGTFFSYSSFASSVILFVSRVSCLSLNF